MANTYLTRTLETPTNRKIWTWSAWVKRCNQVSDYQNAMFGAGDDNTNRSVIRFFGHQLQLQDSANSVDVRTNRLFRDTSAWYHIVVAVDTTQSTSTDRIKFYVNGVQETSFTTATYGSQNIEMEFNTNVLHYINARYSSGIDSISDMVYSHVHFVDGTAYDASAFGSTDATTGEWKINTAPTLTMGTNGFTILKDGNTITDQSANSNDFTLGGGTLTNTEDCPSDVFATMNALDNQIANSTFSNGNNTIQTNTSNYTWNTGTLGMTSKKYYWEIKYSANSNSSYYNLYGIADRPTDGSTDVLGNQTDCSNYGYYADSGGVYAKSTSITSFGASYTVGDIVGVAVDLDNSKLYFSKNGTWQNSGVPTSGATGTGAISIDAVSSTATGVYFPASGDYGSTQNATNQHNFGNGYFGTTAIASEGSNASGIGKFEYDVPTGYTALSTKGLNL